MEQVAPTLAKGKSVKLPYEAAKTGQTVPPSSWPSWGTKNESAVHASEQFDCLIILVLLAYDVCVGVTEGDEVLDLAWLGTESKGRECEMFREDEERE